MTKEIDIITLFPEMFSNGYRIYDRPPEEWKKEAIASDSVFVQTFQKLAQELENAKITIRVKVGEGGKLFGAIASKEIAAAVKEQAGLDVDKKKIVLNDPIKTLGEKEVRVKLHKDVAAALKIQIVEA